MNHTQFMQIALEEAQKAYDLGEVPVGAIVVKDNEIIGRGHNLRETDKRVSAHAEIIALDNASKLLSTWNMSDCILYVTVEPCPMCAGALLQSQLKTIVFGTTEPNSGSFGTVFNINDINGFNHYPSVISGVLEEESRDLMVKFFKERRNEQIKVKKVSRETYDDYMKVRMNVFVEEQGVDSSLEVDAYDDLNRTDVVHILAVYKDEVIGATRLISKEKTLKVGRVAVLKDYRHLKVGSKLMRWADTHAANNGFNRLELGAQLQAIPFYQRNGYTEYGEIFDDAGIDHRMMEKLI